MIPGGVLQTTQIKWLSLKKMSYEKCSKILKDTDYKCFISFLTKYIILKLI